MRPTTTTTLEVRYTRDSRTLFTRYPRRWEWTVLAVSFFFLPCEGLPFLRVEPDDGVSRARRVAQGRGRIGMSRFVCGLCPRLLFFSFSPP